MNALLELKNLTTTFNLENKGPVNAVDGVSFSIHKGQTVGLVGESGCGKSVTSLSILRLIDTPPGKISGQILFEGKDLLTMPPQEMRKIRGNKISMIFQEPMTSLNPVFTIGNQISEVFQIHGQVSKAEAREKALKMLRLVNIPAPDKRIDEYPHQLSGGMRQRIMIAMALACKPSLLIADEPTTALDVTIQAQILDLMLSLQQEFSMAILMITHDLGVVSEVCNDVMVMYGGRIVEQATVEEIFTSPKHPYTEGLLQSIPKLGRKVAHLPTIGGNVPSLGNFPSGCRFHNRCSKAKDICRQKSPPTFSSGNHHVACWLYEKA